MFAFMNLGKMLLTVPVGWLPFAVPLVSLLAGCTSTTHVCTLVKCNDGVSVDFQVRTPGAYDFEVVVDGAKTTCRAALPLAEASPPANPCDREWVILTRQGGQLPAEQQSIGGLEIRSKTARQITLRVTRDGALVGEKTYDITYAVTPGPNGPDCEPKECRSASVTFP